MNAQRNTNTNVPAENELIAQVMKDSTSGNNRQAKLVVIMYENELTYSKAAIAALFAKRAVKTGEGQTFAEALDVYMSDFPAYASAVEHRNELQEQKKTEKEKFTTNQALELEACLNRIKAATELFKRALTATYHLRNIDAFDVKLGKATGAITFYHTLKNDDGSDKTDPKGNVLSASVTMSGNALVRAGAAALTPPKPVTKAGDVNGRNAARAGLAPVAEAVASRVQKARAEGKYIEFFAEEEEKSLEKLLKELMISKFADDRGVIDLEAVEEYIAKELAPKPGNGTTKADSKAKAA